MIAARYSLHLYCENTEFHGYMLNTPFHIGSSNGGFGEYDGETYGECVRQARRDGWVVSHDRTRAYCPHCKKPRAGEESEG